MGCVKKISSLFFFLATSIYAANEEISDEMMRTIQNIKKNIRSLEDLLKEDSIENLFDNIQKTEFPQEEKREIIQKIQSFVGISYGELTKEIDEKKVPAILNASPKTFTQKGQESLTFQQQLNRDLHSLPLANWINLSLIGPFFNPVFRWLSAREENFCSLDSFGRSYLTLDPYLIYSPYRLHDRSVKLLTTGITLQGGIGLDDQWILGGGGGYAYSQIHWEQSQTSMQGIYLGPSLIYLFQNTYLGLRCIGEYVFYGLQKIDGWNFDALLEWGMEFTLPSYCPPDVFIYPQIEINYSLLFLDKKHDLDSLFFKRGDFFRSKVSVQVLKECHVRSFFAVPQLSLGWVWMQPLSQTHSKSLPGIEKMHYQGAQQLYVALGITGIFKRGLALVLNIESYIDKIYPAIEASAKVEWNW